MRRLLFALVIVVACGKNNEPPPPSSGSPNAKPESGPNGGHAGGADPTTKAHDKFATVCAMCHGANGMGDGPAAATLNPKPRNYTDPQWQASVTDDQIRQTILHGGQAMGKSPMMPGNPDLKDQPEVLDALVQIIRGFGKK